jgi:ATP-dependent protease ClpP protease subunit
MAAWILAVGDNRSMTAHSFAMIHEGQFSFSDETMSHTKLEQYRKFHKELERQGWKILGERTKRTAGWWKKKCESGELFLSAVKSRSLGLIDRIT